MSSDGMATPYFMLIQMNNAALLEAYATLGIQASPADISETKFPAGFSLVKALDAIPFGEEDEAEHPGKIHESSADPIKEAEQTTTGKAADALALGRKIAGRFGSNSGDGGDFRALLDAAMAAASLPQIDFDPDIFATGAAVIGNTSAQSEMRPDFGGSAPFAGLRADYRPETARAGPKRDTVRRHSLNASHLGGEVQVVAGIVASIAEIKKARRRGAGTGRVVFGKRNKDR